MPSHKRKLPPSPSSSSSDSDEHDHVRLERPFVTASTKRRRCSTLERGFADLAINHPILQTGTYASSYPSPASSNPSVLDLDLSEARSPSPALMDSEDTYPIIYPTSIEEPISPDLSLEPNDIKMKSQSWYEPEKDRIVITDLDDSDDEADSDVPSVNISIALLDRIKEGRTLTSTPLPFPSTSTALVLFRPLRFGPKEVVDDDEPADTRSRSSPSDDCAMDVEP
ncbi:hypothetical protein PILCRDRAFT_824093 [Piloderma croceum F 1598]|uniref:Uncharacterized protein n=1 Tax=Piloderma croceum (strain F 1598) TaxID=765440 RepID=A0A0C3BNQ5_PILCF|nr:hypothetical protein PILCRDRAFT_824093 [Piloderma croceum F 1598]